MGYINKMNDSLTDFIALIAERHEEIAVHDRLGSPVDPWYNLQELLYNLGYTFCSDCGDALEKAEFYYDNAYCEDCRRAYVSDEEYEKLKEESGDDGVHYVRYYERSGYEFLRAYNDGWRKGWKNYNDNVTRRKSNAKIG